MSTYPAESHDTGGLRHSSYVIADIQLININGQLPYRSSGFRHSGLFKSSLHMCISFD